MQRAAARRQAAEVQPQTRLTFTDETDEFPPPNAVRRALSLEGEPVPAYEYTDELELTLILNFELL